MRINPISNNRQYFNGTKVRLKGYALTKNETSKNFKPDKKRQLDTLVFDVDDIRCIYCQGLNNFFSVGKDIQSETDYYIAQYYDNDELTYTINKLRDAKGTAVVDMIKPEPKDPISRFLRLY